MRDITHDKLMTLIEIYDKAIKGMEDEAEKAIKDFQRAYGGYVRSAKGKLFEDITQQLIETAWVEECRQDRSRLVVNSTKISIPIQKSYVEKIPDTEVRDYIRSNMDRHNYKISVDKHIHVDNRFIMGIECKAYTENAMLKRILVDFRLLKTICPDLICYLFQLESQLGGDYSEVIDNPKGSASTHTLLSFFPEVDLKITTFLEGERKVDKPINKPGFYKELKLPRLEAGLNAIIAGFEESGVM